MKTLSPTTFFSGSSLSKMGGISAVLVTLVSIITFVVSVILIINDKSSEVIPIITDNDLNMQISERAILEFVLEVERYARQTETSSTEATRIAEEARLLKTRAIENQEELEEESELSGILQEGKTQALDIIRASNAQIEIYETEISVAAERANEAYVQADILSENANRISKIIIDAFK